MALTEERGGYGMTYDQRRAADLEAARQANLVQAAAPGLGIGSLPPQQWYPSTAPATPAPYPVPAPAPVPALAPAPAAVRAAAPAQTNAGTPLITPDGEVYGTLEVNAQGQTVVRKLPKGKPNRWNVPANRAAPYPTPPGFAPPTADAGSGLPDFQTLMAQLRAGPNNLGNR